MYDIEMQEPSPEFGECWAAAGTHLDRQVDGGIRFWLRTELTPPFLEHLSFRLGNQLFFVRLEDVEGQVESPGTTRGLRAVADGCAGHACLMPMRRRGGNWVPAHPGWGLVHLDTALAVHPPALVTGEDIMMTPWELHDLAVQEVRKHLVNAGRELISWQSAPGVDPTIWFAGDQGPEWVVVRAQGVSHRQMPAEPVRPPANLAEIARRCASLSMVGHFAGVGVACAEPPSPESLPLRGHGLYVAFEGLSPVNALAKVV